MKRIYAVTRDLHLYFGLFISPLLLVFAVSVPFLVHAWAPGNGQWLSMRTMGDLPVPPGVDLLNGRKQVEALRGVLDRVGVRGEVDVIRRIAKENRLVMRVIVPGHEASVDLNLSTHSAFIRERNTGIASALVYLHKMPGQHLANLRGNWIYMRIWKWLTDGAAYAALFLSVSGIYLWAVLRAERRIGLVLLAAGFCSFCGMVYVLLR